MKKLNVIVKSLTILIAAILFIQCEKDEKNGGSVGDNKVLINGKQIKVTETYMKIVDNSIADKITILTYCTDGINDVVFSIEPPSLALINGTFSHVTGLTPYNLVYSSTAFSTFNSQTGKNETYTSRLSSSVKVTSLGDNNYKFELNLKFDVNENTIDTISGYYTAKLKQ